MPYREPAQSLIDLIRKFLKDFPKLNELKGKSDFNDDELYMFLMMAVSDWNSTPPIMAPVNLETHPSIDWLVVASSVWAMQSMGILHYRNDLAYSDNGVSINPWSKGPQYFGIAGTLAQSSEMKKREMKFAINCMMAGGVVPSPEYFAWNYQAYYYNNIGGPLTSLPTNSIPDTSNNNVPTGPTKTDPIIFDISSWQFNSSDNTFMLNFNHILKSDMIDVKIVDPDTRMDLRNKCQIKFTNSSLVQLFVPSNPDGRFKGEILAYKI